VFEDTHKGKKVSGEPGAGKDQRWGREVARKISRSPLPTKAKKSFNPQSAGGEKRGPVSRKGERGGRKELQLHPHPAR